jgi:hypothetical protein
VAHGPMVSYIVGHYCFRFFCQLEVQYFLRFLRWIENKSFQIKKQVVISCAREG